MNYGDFMKKLAYILALAMMSNYAYAAPAEKAPAKAPAPAEKAVEKAPAPTEKAAEAKLDVRQPTGDVSKFWSNLSWDDLSADERKLWVVLGWNGKIWGSETEPAPVSEGTVWDKLSKEEQAAATALGYDKKSWNQEY